MADEQSQPPDRAQTLVFAHLSDCHLTVPRGPSVRELGTKRLLGYLAWRRHRRHGRSPAVLDALCRDLGERPPDHVVVTGDLVNLGRPEECGEAAGWLSRLGDPRSVTVVPGNHDRYVAESWTKGVGRWQAYMGDEEPGADGFPFLRRRGPVAFIGVNSAIPTPPLLATGRIGPEQLARLDRLLAEAGAAGLFRVLLIHHPPTSAVGWRKRLVDATSLSDVLRAHGAELILHGHCHRFARGELPGPDGPIPVLGVPSASQGGADPARSAAYLRCTVTAAAGEWQLSVESRARDPATGGFRHDPRRGWQTRMGPRQGVASSTGR